MKGRAICGRALEGHLVQTPICPICITIFSVYFTITFMKYLGYYHACMSLDLSPVLHFHYNGLVAQPNVYLLFLCALHFTVINKQVFLRISNKH